LPNRGLYRPNEDEVDGGKEGVEEEDAGLNQIPDENTWKRKNGMRKMTSYCQRKRKKVKVLEGEEEVEELVEEEVG
jgi:hypothetical protein